jgi:hypothetical protein
LVFGGPEYGVAGAVAWFGLERFVGGEEAGGWVGVVDAYEVGAQVGEEEILPCWVEESLMDVAAMVLVYSFS